MDSALRGEHNEMHILCLVVAARSLAFLVNSPVMAYSTVVPAERRLKRTQPNPHQSAAAASAVEALASSSRYVVWNDVGKYQETKYDDDDTMPRLSRVRRPKVSKSQ